MWKNNGCSALEQIKYNKNQLISLNASGCGALERLECYENALVSLNINGCTSLKWLECYTNQLRTLDASECPALERLVCHGNALVSLDITGCASLKTLECFNNQLAILDASGCNELEILQCQNNQLVSLEINRGTALKWLECYGNQLTTLNVSGCIELRRLSCQENRLVSLDVSGCDALNYLDCYYNYLPSEPTGIEFCPVPSSNYQFAYQYSTDITNRIKDENFRSAVYEILNKDPGSIIYYSDLANITELDVSKRNISSLEGIHLFRRLEVLDCSRNQLTELDLSKNTLLRELDCSHNQLQEVPKGLHLEEYVHSPQRHSGAAAPFFIGLFIIGGIVLSAIRSNKKKQTVQNIDSITISTNKE